MTKLVHLLNVLLYAVNGLMWGFYAHSIPMAIVSFAVALGSAFYAQRAEEWMR